MDSSIYGALARLSQPWIMRYPLIDWHGSNGNIAGDGPASMRYTEARLSKLAEDGLLNGIKKNNVEFIPNYDETLQEPVTLPSLFPNLLCNPNEGIGIAIACKWAPHNLKEVAAAIKAYINNEAIPVIAPDFPTGGVIINKNDIPAIMKTGHGSVKIRGKYKIEKNQIIFYEIPYGETIEGIIAQIGKASDDESIQGIEDVHDESNKKGIRIVITCKKDVEPTSLLSTLFAKTALQSSFSYNQVALVGKTPTELNLVDCLKIYVDHNLECLTKELNYDLAQAKDRLEVVDGILMALASIDDIIKCIKASNDRKSAIENLQKQFNFTERQATAIGNMRLTTLANLEKVAYEKEKTELQEKINNILNILSTKDNLSKELLSRLDKIVEKFGDARRTELTQLEITKEKKVVEEIIPEDVVVIVTQNGDVKRVPKANFKTQKRNTRGIKTADAAIMTTISTNTLDTLMVFSNNGKMYKISVNKIPVGTSVSRGTPLQLLVKMDNNEKVSTVTSLHCKTNAKYVVFFTKKGYVKKTDLEEYTSIKKTTGTQAIKFKDGDSLANVTFLTDEEIILISRNGMCIKFPSDTIAATGRVTMGVKGIKLDDNDELLIGLPIKHPSDNLAVIVDDGIGKQIPLSDFTIQARGGKGLLCNKSKNVAAAAITNKEDVVLIIGQSNSVCIEAKDIPVVSRVAMGNHLIKTSKVLFMVKV